MRGRARAAARRPDHGVVDELDLSVSPSLVGSGPRLLDGVLADVVRPELRLLLEEDGTLFARYALAPGAR